MRKLANDLTPLFFSLLFVIVLQKLCQMEVYSSLNFVVVVVLIRCKEEWKYLCQNMYGNQYFVMMLITKRERYPLGIRYGGKQSLLLVLGEDKGLCPEDATSEDDYTILLRT
ncbi:unnamed protein product [Sphenostylis stenocarpa]|uniref:Uncharacterized protein n=1 Tax=Sphenostylis stenocarpa TaxID=92480 RepID=A0AA86S3V0_9FABA|nr:unnamed protein product [Sphenostylis stenocarpa]